MDFKSIYYQFTIDKDLTLWKKQKLEQLRNNGKIFCSVKYNDFVSYFISIMESRGYQTGYKHKRYFWLVLIKDNKIIEVTGISKAGYPEIIDKWNKNNVTYTIYNQELFNAWIKRGKLNKRG